MPLYSFECGVCDKRETAFRAVEQRNEAPICCEQPMIRVITAPMIAVDIEPYRSPIDGRAIYSREQRKEDLRRHGCVEWDPGLQEHGSRARHQADEKLDAELDATVDRLVAEMPAVKRERLIEEVRGGADVQIVRSEL